METKNNEKEKISALRTSKEERNLNANYKDKSYCNIKVDIGEDGTAFAEIEFFAGKNFPTHKIFEMDTDNKEETRVLSLEELENGFSESSSWITKDSLVYQNFSIEKCRAWVEDKSAKVRELLLEFENLNKFKTGEKMDCVEIYGV